MTDFVYSISADLPRLGVISLQFTLCTFSSVLFTKFAATAPPCLCLSQPSAVHVRFGSKADFIQLRCLLLSESKLPQKASR